MRRDTSTKTELGSWWLVREHYTVLFFTQSSYPGATGIPDYTFSLLRPKCPVFVTIQPGAAVQSTTPT